MDTEVVDCEFSKEHSVPLKGDRVCLHV